jgi:diadenylate cyclase
MQELIDDVQRSLERLDAAAALDILIIWLVIFALLMALRGTTAMTLLRGGVVILLLLFLLGQVLQLTVVSFLIENTLPGLVLAVVVIFQPEIRRALERAGRTGIRNLLANADRTTALDVIGVAIGDLAREKHGAIVVLERTTGLEDYIETGVRLDADLSSPLLEGIFFPNSALHDKAVIVRGDKIVAAACTLPLAEGPGSASLGTRHRAALGVTERTDAVAIVVSEETGGVSIAADGRIIRLRDETGVRSTLQAVLSGRNGIRPRPRTT